MDRREFLLLSGSCVATGCALLRGGAAHQVYAAPPASLVGPTLEIPIAMVNGLSGDDALLVEWGKGKPDLLIARRPEAYLVVTADCTHQGCTIAWSGTDSEWQCPCHGSRFAIDGKVVHGPAEEPLQAPRVEVTTDKLVIHVEGLS